MTKSPLSQHDPAGPTPWRVLALRFSRGFSRPFSTLRAAISIPPQPAKPILSRSGLAIWPACLCPIACVFGLVSCGTNLYRDSSVEPFTAQYDAKLTRPVVEIRNLSDKKMWIRWDDCVTATTASFEIDPHTAGSASAYNGGTIVVGLTCLDEIPKTVISDKLLFKYQHRYILNLSSDNSNNIIRLPYSAQWQGKTIKAHMR